ncbi:uncharacterized protein LOC111796185 [Cucurbita pepo subsp. pepo]|uniref:uncharacterized protein LOC111796185 n=1 Tax=Cucurbita pepo subsp. pepo TaxID=3664 RepID=UPI000C9D7BF6|nr:uncharacterized protein LOC111796185 [Cucurbita pepo subsp. pepo]
MFFEILCGFIAFRLLRRFFGQRDELEIETSDSNALFAVASRLEKIYSGKIFVGLRIPDADTGLRQSIDMVLVTKGEAVVVLVKNISGFVSVSADGSWICEGDGRQKSEILPDPVAETRRWASILESYLERRGVALPEGYLSWKVLLPNPKFRTVHSNYFPSEVITYDQWMQLKPEPKSMFSGWIKSALRGGKKEIQESKDEKLNFVLNTAPMWDRLELKGNNLVLGEFLEFKGKKEDMQTLREIKRSKVSCIVIQKMRTIVFGPSRLRVLYSTRNYQNEGTSASEWKEITIGSNTMVVFQMEYSSKVRKIKISSIVSLSLSA